MAIATQAMGYNEKAASYYHQAAVGYQDMYGPEDRRAVQMFAMASCLRNNNVTSVSFKALSTTSAKVNTDFGDINYTSTSFDTWVESRGADCTWSSSSESGCPRCSDRRELCSETDSSTMTPQGE